MTVVNAAAAAKSTLTQTTLAKPPTASGAPANSPSLHTDEVDKSCKKATDLLSFTVFSTKPNVQECIAAIPVEAQVYGQQNHPFWIFNVGSDVMNSHGDVWNQTVTELITNIITRHPKFQALSLATQ